MWAQIKGPQSPESVPLAGAGPGSNPVSPAKDKTCTRPQPLTSHRGWQLERAIRGPGFFSLSFAAVSRVLKTTPGRW